MCACSTSLAAWPVPSPGMLLADLGADVVKMHPPGPAPLAGQPGPLMWDRGKRAVTGTPRTPATSWRSIS